MRSKDKNQAVRKQECCCKFDSVGRKSTLEERVASLEKLVTELESKAATDAVAKARLETDLVQKQKTIDVLNDYCDELVDELAAKDTLAELSAKLNAMGVTAVELAVFRGELDDWDDDLDEEEDDYDEDDDDDDDDDWDDL